MPSLILNDVVKIRLVCSCRSQLVENVRHYKVTALAGTGVTEGIAATAIKNALSTPYLAAISSTVTLVTVGLQLVQLDGHPLRIEVFSPVASAGGLTGDALPNLLAGLISLRTGVVGSKGRGRMYMPPANEASNDATGVPTATYIGLLGTLGDALIADVPAGSGGNTVVLSPGLLSRHTSTLSLLTSRVTPAEWATQRRRRIGIGV